LDQLKNLIKRLNHRYLIIGVAVYLFELVVIVVAQKRGASPLLAVGLSFWLGLIVSFILQKIVTFKDKRMHHKILIPQILGFLALVLVNFCFTLLLTKLISPPVPAILARSIALAITMVWNLYIYRSYVFSNKLKPGNK
jgi:putative flippase GtrA